METLDTAVFRSWEIISHFGAETFRKDRNGSFTRYVRFEFSRNFIYKNRYVFSGTGNVIDIFKKALVTEEADDYVKL